MYFKKKKKSVVTKNRINKTSAFTNFLLCKCNAITLQPAGKTVCRAAQQLYSEYSVVNGVSARTD